MKTAAFCLSVNSSSAGILSRLDGVEVNLSDGNIQLKRALGSAAPDARAAADAVVDDDDDDDDIDDDDAGCMFTELISLVAQGLCVYSKTVMTTVGLSSEYR